jgi:hypothetical protein
MSFVYSYLHLLRILIIISVKPQTTAGTKGYSHKEGKKDQCRNSQQKQAALMSSEPRERNWGAHRTEGL